jgi:hypothetical protein
MSRLINTDSTGKLRAQMTKAIALAVRQLSLQTGVTDEARDLAAFIALGLQAISDGIDSSVAAWEKRGYWVKADRFRLEWAWASPLASKIRSALVADNWGDISVLAVDAAQRLSKVRVSEHHRLGKPWRGAFARLQLT